MPFTTKYRSAQKNFIEEFLQDADALLHACLNGNNNNIQYIQR